MSETVSGLPLWQNRWVFRREESMEHATDRLLNTVLDIASGTASWGEVLREGDEVMSRFGAAL